MIAEHTEQRLEEIRDKLGVSRHVFHPPEYGIRLPFNGTLSPDEERMRQQFAFAEWEEETGY